MSGSLTIDNTIATVSFTYTADIDKAQAVIENYCEYIYKYFQILDEDGNIIPFDELASQQKIDIVDQKIKQDILFGARENIIDKAMQQASYQSNSTIDLE